MNIYEGGHWTGEGWSEGGIDRAVWTSLPLSILPSACMEGGVSRGKDGQRQELADRGM